MNPAELYTQLATQTPKRETPVVEPEDNFVLPELTEAEEKELGDKLNAQIQGYGKTKSLIKGDNKLKGAGVKGRIEYQRGRHAIEGKGEYRPDRQEGSAGLTYKFKFQEGTKNKTIGGKLKEMLKKTPKNRNLKNAIAAFESGVDYKGFLTAKEKQKLGIK